MYRGQIRCHLTMGQQAAALCVYRRCRELLSIVLGVAPAPQTEVLVAALRADEVWPVRERRRGPSAAAAPSTRKTWNR